VAVALGCQGAATGRVLASMQRRGAVAAAAQVLCRRDGPWVDALEI